jgi:hypothetical protein
MLDDDVLKLSEQNAELLNKIYHEVRSQVLYRELFLDNKENKDVFSENK